MSSSVSCSFAYDSDEEPPEEEPTSQFFWRLPPEESHSDWTIEVVTLAASPLQSDSLVLPTTTTNSSSSSSPHNGGGKDNGTTASLAIATTSTRTTATTAIRSAATASNGLLRGTESDAAHDDSADRFYKQLEAELLNAGSSSSALLSSSLLLSKQPRSSPVVPEPYHVHKCILAAGPRKCEYFVRLFQNEHHFSESHLKASRIQLHPLASNAFADMLDYVYRTHEPLRITTQTAVALHYLGQYFENRKLRWDAKQFWKHDLTFGNCHIYYEHAKVFADDKILEAVTRCCVENFFFIQASSAIVQVSDPSFWPDILSKLDITKETSLHASYLMTQVCMLHKYDQQRLSRKLFLTLTNELYLPHIYEAVAKDLLDLHDHFQQQDDDSVEEDDEDAFDDSEHREEIGIEETVEQPPGNGGEAVQEEADGSAEKEIVVLDDIGQNETKEEEEKYQQVKEQPFDSESATEPLKSHHLSSLQQRCIDALAENWRGIQVCANGLTDNLRTQDSLVLAELLARALFHAQEKVERDERHLTRMRHTIDERDAELAKSEQRLQEANAGWLRALYDVENLKNDLKQAKEGWRQAHDAWEKAKAGSSAAARPTSPMPPGGVAVSTATVVEGQQQQRKDKPRGRERLVPAVRRLAAASRP